MKRLLTLLTVAVLVAACSDSDLTTGPTDPSANIGNIPRAGMSDAYGSDICGTVIDPVNGLPGEQVASPCDGDSNIGAVATGPDAGKLPYTGSTYWLSSFEKSPSPIPANFSGLASRLKVRAYPYPNQAACVTAAGTAAGGICDVRDLPAVTEVIDATTGASLRYTTSWKTKKDKKGGPGSGDYLPNNTYWQVVAFLDFDGSGTWDANEDIASRILKWTDTPSTDNPLDGWSLDVNWGSNQNIPFVLEANQSGCFGTAQDYYNVECIVDLNLGGTLIVETDDGAIILKLGAGNDLGLRTVTGSVCDEESLDVDTDTIGTCTTWEFDPPLLPSDPLLVDSGIFACEDLLGTLDLTAYSFFMQDEDGTQALVPIDQGTASAVCDSYNFMARAREMGTGIRYVLNRIKQMFRPEPLWAGHGTSGSRLDTSRSSFQLVQSAQMRPVGSASVTVPENSTTTLQAVVKDHADEEVGEEVVSDAVVYVFSKAGGGGVACPASPTDASASCVDYSGALPSWAGDGVVVTTGTTGLVEADASVLTLSTEVRFLGCAIAVPGSDSPASGGYAGDAGLCDRDPGDEDDGTDGYANGPAVGITDPWALDDADAASWINDLPLVYSLQVCAAPTVDGVKSSTDPWSDGSPSSCIPSGFSDTFDVNVGGNVGGGGSGTIMASLEWFVGTDTNGDRRVFFGLEIPLASDPTSKKVSAAITFDQGDGSIAGSGVANEYDDQIVIDLDKFSASPTGDVTDRYLKSNCTSGTSVCNSDDSDLGGNNDAQGAMAWDAGTSTLFLEFSQKLTGGDATVDMSGLSSGSVLGFLMQIGVGNVQQGGTVYPDQSGGRTYKFITLP